MQSVCLLVAACGGRRPARIHAWSRAVRAGECRVTAKVRHDSLVQARRMASRVTFTLQTGTTAFLTLVFLK